MGLQDKNAFDLRSRQSSKPNQETVPGRIDLIFSLGIRHLRSFDPSVLRSFGPSLAV